MNLSTQELRAKLKGLKRLDYEEKAARLEGAQDFYTFVKTYFPHHIKIPETSIFRQEIYKNIDTLTKEERNILIQAYRGGAKTTLISRLFVLWKQLVRHENFNTLIISATIFLSKKTLEFIKSELEDNELLRSDFGVILGEKWSEEEIIYGIVQPASLQERIAGGGVSANTSKNGGRPRNPVTSGDCKEDRNTLDSRTSDEVQSFRGFKGTHVSLVAGEALPPREIKFKISVFGAMKKIRGENWRGHRPSLIICDDLENDENVKTKAQRDKMEEWFNKAVMKLPARGDMKHNIIIVGTTLHHDSLLKRLEARGDFKSLNFPLVRKFGADFDANPSIKGMVLDDSRLDKSAILREYLTNKEAFYSEYQNEPLSRDGASFSGYQTFEAMPHCESYALGIDPALGKAKGDYFGVAILGYLNATFYASVRLYKIKAPEMIERLLEIYLGLLALNRPIKIGIETVQFQEFFKDTLEQKARDMGLFLPVVELKNHVNKELRIDSLAPYIHKGQILIDKSAHLLREELETYPKSAHDDGLDALEMAFRVLKVPNFDYEKVNAFFKKRGVKKKMIERLLQG